MVEAVVGERFDAGGSEAVSADIQALGLERGHRTLTITRKGGKVGTIPLAPRITRAIDLAVGERCDGPIFLAADGRRLDRHGAARIVRRAACKARISVINGTWWRRQQAAIQVSFCGRGRPRSWGLAGQLAPQPSYLSVMRHDRSARRPGVQAVAPVLAPPADHRPLRQLAHGDKGQPDPRAGELAENPRRRLVLLEQRRDIGVDDDITHRSQASEASDSQMSAASSPGSATGSACCAREILDGNRPVSHRSGFLVRMAHANHGTRAKAEDPGSSPGVASVACQRPNAAPAFGAPCLV
jgi:hypothetical protein